MHPRQARCGSGDGGGGGRELAPRTDQYLKHREVSSRYFRSPSKTGNEGVKNIYLTSSYIYIYIL